MQKTFNLSSGRLLLHDFSFAASLRPAPRSELSPGTSDSDAPQRFFVRDGALTAPPMSQRCRPGAPFKVANTVIRSLSSNAAPHAEFSTRSIIRPKATAIPQLSADEVFQSELRQREQETNHQLFLLFAAQRVLPRIREHLRTGVSAVHLHHTWAHVVTAALEIERLTAASPSSSTASNEKDERSAPSGDVWPFLVFHVQTPQEVEALPAPVRHIAVPVAAGELANRMLFGRPTHEMDLLMNAVMDAAFARGEVESPNSNSTHPNSTSASSSQIETKRPVSVTACLLSALSCPFEGAALHPTRTADFTQRLLHEGCSAVLWDDSAATCAPRMLENIIKTSMATGVNVSQSVGIVFRDNVSVAASNAMPKTQFHQRGAKRSTASCAQRALEFGITRFGSQLPTDHWHMPQGGHAHQTTHGSSIDQTEQDARNDTSQESGQDSTSLVDDLVFEAAGAARSGIIPPQHVLAWTADYVLQSLPVVDLLTAADEGLKQTAEALQDAALALAKIDDKKQKRRTTSSE